MQKYFKLLGRTLEVQSKSGNEKRMKKFVKNYLTGLGLKPKSDNHGNIFCHKGDMRKSRPFVVAHLDTVHQVNGNVQTFYNDDFFFAFDMKTMRQYGVGGDDKVGIWSALAAITEFDNISVAFFVQEEVGCVGSNAVKIDQFKKANWLVQLDRREDVDFITSNMASEDFINDMEPLANKLNFVNTSQTTITDVSTLYRRRVGVSSVNIASGYWFPHSDKEIVMWDAAANALKLTFQMIKKYGDKKYPHLPEVKKPKPYTTTSNKTIGYKQKGVKKFRSSANTWEGAQYVNGMIRVWNSFYGCFEWRDYSGNLRYYEGIGNKHGHFSKSPKQLRSSLVAPPQQEAVPMKLGHNMVNDDRTYNDAAIQANLDFEDVNDQPTDGMMDEETERYWADKAEEAALEQMVKDAEDKAAELGQLAEDGEIKTYHDFDAKYYELAAARRQIDAALYLYGYSFSEFIDGLIPDDHIKNISSTLHYDHGETLSYYERMFGIEGSYDSSHVAGCFTDFSKREGDMPF